MATVSGNSWNLSAEDENRLLEKFKQEYSSDHQRREIFIDEVEGPSREIRKDIFHWQKHLKKDPSLQTKINKANEYIDMLEKQAEDLWNMRQKYPPWKFYTYKQSVTPGVFRVLGIDMEEIEEAGKCNLHLRLFKAEDNKIVEVNRIPYENITEIEEWTPAHIEIINKCSAPEAFLRRIGFSYFIKLKQQMREEKEQSRPPSAELIDPATHSFTG